VCEKLTKCPNFTRFLPEKLEKYPNFYYIFPKNYQNFRTLHDFCPKMLEFYIIIARKKFPEFKGGGARAPPPCPPSPTPRNLTPVGCADGEKTSLRG